MMSGTNEPDPPRLGRTWHFGRGASIANGLPWVVPEDWKHDITERRVKREYHIKMTVETLRRQMDGGSLNCLPYRRLLGRMTERTVESGYHLLMTTNWDNLLQLEVDAGIARHCGDVAPKFLGTGTVVQHFNGSIDGSNPRYRDPFVLETDASHARRPSHEGSTAFNHLLWSPLVVIVGMSFECDVDKSRRGERPRDGKLVKRKSVQGAALPTGIRA